MRDSWALWNGERISLRYALATLTSQELLELCVYVPDHGWIRPFRFCGDGDEVRVRTSDGMLMI